MNAIGRCRLALAAVHDRLFTLRGRRFRLRSGNHQVSLCAGFSPFFLSLRASRSGPSATLINLACEPQCRCKRYICSIMKTQENKKTARDSLLKRSLLNGAVAF